MANGFNSGPDRDAMLRRVAIVLSSLPAPLSAQLMGSIDPESKRAISRTITTLSDVDPLERRRALHAFKMSVERQPRSHDVAPANSHANSDLGNRVQPASPDRFDSSSASAAAALANHPIARVVSASEVKSATETSSSPLSFLNDVDEATLVRLLAVEHPQAVALVLASIAPEQAARVLPQLESRVQNDALSRIGRLGEIPDAAATEIAEHFRNRLGQQEQPERHATGRRALDAILAALPSERGDSAHGVASPPVSSTARSPSQPPQHAPAGPTGVAASIAPVSFPTSDVPALDLTHKLRVAEETWPDKNDASEPQPSSHADHSAASDFASPHTGSDRFESTDAIHQHLLNLTPSALCQALGRVDTRDMVLALCGLPNETTEAALATLPRAHARKVRSNMATLGSLHLREIDEAKERVARASTSDQTRNVPLAA